MLVNDEITAAPQRAVAHGAAIVSISTGCLA